MLVSLRNLLVVLAASAAAVPWHAGPAAAIAYGDDAPDRAYRFAVMLTMTGLPAEGGGTRDSWCSGALIAPRWVITAGHCFRDAGGRRVGRTVAERTTAIVGRAEPGGPGGHEVEVVGAVQAEGADVALAELAEPITDVPPIPLADRAPRPGEVLRLAGFGLTGDGDGTRPPEVLQTGTFTVDAVGDTLIEASGRSPRADTSPCPHDSGGPYFRQEPGGRVALVAVVSSGPSCPHTGPDFSARVDSLAGWVSSTTSRPASGPLPSVAWAGAAALLAGAGLAALVVTRRKR
ncbi:trypsin-like serine protease [Actinoplanes missouriensis]|uniref:S1 family peptidase n=1 Tax=Actinoplanes missouriensis TaxID=1866 RepID=UPI0034024E4B